MGGVRETRLAVPASDRELASDRLWAAGAQAVEERSLGNRVEFRSVLSEDDETSRRRLGSLPSDWKLRFATVDATPSQAWRRFAQPVVVSDRLTIVPAWLEAPPPRRREHLVVSVEPGAAFGLGDHPTTRLAAELLDDLDLDGRSMLDVGTGTGVLAVIAALRGARPVLGIDIADAAVEAAAANARRADVELEVATTPLAGVEAQYDVVVANILAPALIAMGDDLVRVTAADLIISGVLAEAHDHVLAALRPLTPVRTIELDGWAVVHLRVPGT